MKSFAVAFVLATFCAASAAAQSAPPSETASSEASLAPGTVINAELKSSIDSKKAKPGDQEIAQTTEPVKSTDGRTILPKGAKIIGHVTQASSRSNGQGEAMLAIHFDKVVTKDGQEIPLSNVIIQAAAAPSTAASAYSTNTDRTTTPGTPTNNPSMSGSRGARPDTTPTTQPYPSANPNGAPGGESYSAGPLPANTHGVYGLEGVRLSAHGNEGTVLTSTNKNVRLDGGTRLLLAVQPQGGTASPSSR
jgi:hypothetical protein